MGKLNVYVVFMTIASPAVESLQKKCSCWIFLNVSGQMILSHRGASMVLSVLCRTLSYCFSPHHCPYLKGQSLGHLHPSPSHQSPGKVTHPPQHCFQLQKKAGVCQFNHSSVDPLWSRSELFSLSLSSIHMWTFSTISIKTGPYDNRHLLGWMKKSYQPHASTHTQKHSYRLQGTECQMCPGCGLSQTAVYLVMERLDFL